MTENFPVPGGRLQSATGLELKTLCKAMNAAFSDYKVPMQLSLGEFELMVHMRGLSLAHSQIVTSADEVVAFWLIGTRGRQAYLISSGTLPVYRRRGLSQILGRAAIKSLSDQGFETLQSEVLDVNASARGLYRTLGFAETRSLSSFVLPRISVPTEKPEVSISTGAAPVSDARDWQDVAPSWQNDWPSLRAAGAACRVVQARDPSGLAGYAAFVPVQNSLAQVDIRPDLRRRKLATTLVATGLDAFGLDRVRVINVDQSADPVFSFLHAHRAEPLVSQKELLLRLVKTT